MKGKHTTVPTASATNPPMTGDKNLINSAWIPSVTAAPSNDPNNDLMRVALRVPCWKSERMTLLIDVLAPVFFFINQINTVIKSTAWALKDNESASPSPAACSRLANSAPNKMYNTRLTAEAMDGMSAFCCA